MLKLLGSCADPQRAYLLFDERLDAISIAGMVACATAVFLVNRPRR